jgi:integrase
LLSKREPESGQRLVIRYLKYLKDKRKLSGSSIEGSRNAISGLVSSVGISKIDFGIVSKKVGIIRNKKGKGRIPTKEEIRKVLDVCDLRSKALILILCSSGIKIGALLNLKWKDVAPVTLGHYSFAKILVHRNQNGEYTSFITSEAWQILSEYRKERTDSQGEGIDRESYVISKTHSYSPNKEIGSGSDALSIKYLERYVGTKWKLVGLRRGNETGNANVIRHEFKVFWASGNSSRLGAKLPVWMRR